MGAMENSVEGSSGRVTLVECLTTAVEEPFTLEVHHEWAPLGAQRFVDLVEDDYFTEVAFFRCVQNFLVQFGISSDPQKKAFWKKQRPIADDPLLGVPFKRGMLSFAGSTENSRTTQLFIALADSQHLGKAPWEVPLGIVTKGMETVVDKLYSGYGEQKGFNPEGIDQGRLMTEGNTYLRQEFPLISYFKSCKVMHDDVEEAKAGVASRDVVIGANFRGNSQVPVGDQHAFSTGQEKNKSAAEATLDKTSHEVSIYVGLIVFAATVVIFGYRVWRKNVKDRRLTR